MKSTAATLSPEATPEPIGLVRIIAHFIFGVFLPAFTLGFEIVTGFSDEIYVNPIPSVFHAFVVGLVPAILAWNLFRCTRRQFARPWDLHLNSLAIAITMVYAVIYLPISPFAAVGIIAYGLGFLPLSPIIALFSAYRLRRELKRRLDDATTIGWRHFLTGFAAGLALLAIASVPRIATDYGLAQYMRAGSDNKSAAIQLLRTFGSEEVLLKACYRRADPIFFWGGGSRLETAEARKLYYRVTGESFNENRREQGNFWTMRGGSSFDRDLGGEHVGQRIDEINLQESRLDGLIDPQSGTGYVEWTMVFRNDDARREHEARLLLSMPTGGVASRVTLWVNGEAREAAFGSKAKGSSHAQRVWLANQIRSLARHSYNQQARLGPSKFQIEIARIADRAAEAYLVTQLSGAVVLETDQQYKENDLEAGDPNQVPTVPEYKHFALIMGMASLTWLVGRRRRR